MGSQIIAPSAALVTQSDSAAFISLVAAHVGRSVAEALRPTSGASSAANTAPQQQDLGKGNKYDIYELSVDKGFSGVDAINEIQRVWYLF